jgi:Pyrimidine 5'-nucleotidase (UMPH-1)
MRAENKYRKNVMVMGDILDDVKMCRESEHDVVLKVGYLNDMARNSHLLEEFTKTFDIVITGDGSL